MRCAEACFANNNCNFFTYNSKSSICTLKTVTVMSFIQIVFNQPGSLCGLIDKRLLSSGNPSPVVSLFGRQWMVNHDSSYLLSPGCSFSGSNTTSVVKTPNIDACAQECKALSEQCLYFVFASSNHDCLLNNNDNKGNNPQFVDIWGELTCAVVNQYSLFNNVEFMPAKCDCTVDNHETATDDDDFSFYDFELEWIDGFVCIFFLLSNN